MNVQTATRRANAFAQEVLNTYMHYLRLCAFVSDGMSHGPIEERDNIDSAREMFEATQKMYREYVDGLSDQYPRMKESKKMKEAYKVAKVTYRPSPYSK